MKQLKDKYISHETYFKKIDELENAKGHYWAKWGSQVGTNHFYTFYGSTLQNCKLSDETSFNFSPDRALKRKYSNTELPSNKR